MLEGARSWAALLAAGFLLLSAGCGLLRWGKSESIQARVDVLAILPLERAESYSDAPVPDSGSRLTIDAEDVVTAQVYGVLVERPRWRLIADLAVGEALRDIPKGQSLEARARALGKATTADGVLCGRVFRFVERGGSEFGSREPASVSLELELVLSESGEVVWKGRFDQTQQPLSSNLFNWWMFWRAGPRWFSARELARLGVERLIDDLQEKLE